MHLKIFAILVSEIAILFWGILSFGSSGSAYHSFYLPRHLKFEEGKVLFFAVSFEFASCSWSVEEECLRPLACCSNISL